jgi:sensor histidine kinase regulating citrate/malate metabolism
MNIKTVSAVVVVVIVVLAAFSFVSMQQKAYAATCSSVASLFTAKLIADNSRLINAIISKNPSLIAAAEAQLNTDIRNFQIALSTCTAK